MTNLLPTMHCQKLGQDVVTSATSHSALVCGWTRSKKLFDNFILTFLFIIAAGQTFFKYPNFGNAKRWWQF
jgi:hypothetical protein